MRARTSFFFHRSSDNYPFDYSATVCVICVFLCHRSLRSNLKVDMGSLTCATVSVRACRAHTHTHTHTLTHRETQTHTDIQTHTQIHTHTRTRTHTHAHTETKTHTDIQTHTDRHTHADIHTHRHRHTETHRPVSYTHLTLPTKLSV